MLAVGEALQRGASGAFLTVFRERLQARPQESVWAFSLLYVVSLFATYAFLLTFPLETPVSGQIDFSNPPILVLRAGPPPPLPGCRLRFTPPPGSKR